MQVGGSGDCDGVKASKIHNHSQEKCFYNFFKITLTKKWRKMISSTNQYT